MNKTILLLFLVFTSFFGIAQPGDPGGDPDAPIGAIELLLAAGGALGIRKLWKGRKPQ